ncbi:translation initiation factor IF-2-like [Elephas maximus indicus]|uniref:translation initiation factor IF-2-like n=1 Tax=Elephas maximus indicus TaxID=99487 RepID=UPI002116C5D9|nr:translation initiation factor IF-2-like [Elephas maximus indicus]
MRRRPRCSARVAPPPTRPCQLLLSAARWPGPPGASATPITQSITNPSRPGAPAGPAPRPPLRAPRGGGLGVGGTSSLPCPGPALAPAGAVDGGTARHLGGAGRVRGPCSSQSQKRKLGGTSSHADPRDGPGKVCPGKKLGEVAAAGPGGGAGVAWGLSAAPTHSPRAGLLPRGRRRPPEGPGIPEGRGPRLGARAGGLGGGGRRGVRAGRGSRGRPGACLLPTPPLQPRRGQKTGPPSPGPRRRLRAPPRTP